MKEKHKWQDFYYLRRKRKACKLKKRGLKRDSRTVNKEKRLRTSELVLRKRKTYSKICVTKGKERIKQLEVERLM